MRSGGRHCGRRARRDRHRHRRPRRGGGSRRARGAVAVRLDADAARPPTSRDDRRCGDRPARRHLRHVHDRARGRRPDVGSPRVPRGVPVRVPARAAAHAFGTIGGGPAGGRPGCGTSGGGAARRAAPSLARPRPHALLLAAGPSGFVDSSGRPVSTPGRRRGANAEHRRAQRAADGRAATRRGPYAGSRADRGGSRRWGPPLENERLQAERGWPGWTTWRASRARIVEAQASERRRLERNLHDGAQQRLVAAPSSCDGRGARHHRSRLSAARSSARRAGSCTRRSTSCASSRGGSIPALLTDRGLGARSRGARRAHLAGGDGRS